jgi:competence protein ComEC
MNRWIPYAFVRIVLFFMLGICVSIFYPELFDELTAKLICLSAFFVYVVLVVILRRRTSRARSTNLKVYAGVIGLSAVFFAGIARVDSNTETNNPIHIINASSIDFFKVVVSTAAVEKENSWKAEAEVEEINAEGEWKSATGTIMLYLSKEDFISPPAYGDVLLIKGKPQLVPPPSNPEEFDYRRFLSFKNIYHQRFIKKDNAKQIGFGPPGWIDYYALKTRKWADNTIRQYVSGEREKALASGLVLGITDGLDDELLSAYRATGTLHVLAVSGLHVGILYGIVLLILTPLKKLKNGPWIAAVVSVVILWAYAFVTGLSPSVLRAVTMFSFVAIAKPGGHRTNIYNTLAVSAFLILWYDPFFIMSVGFQLSYLAVLGIVYIQPGLYNVWNPANRILDEIWKVSSVSIAAQISTFSLSLFYFHQFPNYFLVSNLVAIPASFVVLVLGLAILATPFLSPLASALGFLLEWVIKVMNAAMFTIEDLPFSLVENIYITPLQCWLLFAILLAVLLLLRTRKFVWLKVAFFTGVIFSCMHWYHYTKEINVRKIIVYNIAGHTAVEFFDNGQVYFLGDSALKRNPKKISFHIASNRIKSGARKTYSGDQIRESRPGCSLIVWNRKSILQIHESTFSLPGTLQLDLVIISNDAVKNVDELLKQIDTKNIILDSSNSRYNVSKLMQNTEAEIYSVAHQGAFELKI